MTDDAPIPPDDDAPLTDLETRLAGWTPAPAADSAGRDRLLFEAGAQAGRRQARRQAGALGLVLIVFLGGWIYDEHEARVRLATAAAAYQAMAIATTSPPAVVHPPALRTEPLAPSSVLALSRQFARDDFARIDSAPPPPSGMTPPDPDRAVPILTPRGCPGFVDPLTM